MIRRDDIQLWRDSQLLDGLGMLHAVCSEHRYTAHSHDYYVIAAFQNGAQRHRISQHQGIAHPGTVMIIPPGAVHTGEGAERGRAWEYSAFYPTCASLEELAREQFSNGRGSLDFGKELLIDDPALAAHLLDAHAVAQRAQDPLERQCAVYEAFALLIRRYGQRPGAVKREPPLDASIKGGLAFMHENFACPLTVKDIAGAADLSEFHFMRTFRAKMGLTVHAYLTQHRLEAAKSMLASGTPASETALNVGFFDQSHFTAQFRSHFGVTPRRFAVACR